MPTTLDMLNAGLALQKAGKLQDAARVYTDILKSDPNQADASHLLGLVAHAQGDHSRAVQLIQRAVACTADNAVYLGNLGVALRHTGDIDGAIKAYTQAIALDPNHVDAHYNIAKAYKLKRDYSSAIQHYRRSLAIEPQKEGP